MVLGAVSLFATFAVILAAVTLLGVDRLPVLVGLLFVSFAWLGLVIPSTMVLSLENHGPIAGIASALGGTLQMVTGAIMIVVVSLVFNGTPKPMVVTIALCALAALVVSVMTLRGREFAPAAAE